MRTGLFSVTNHAANSLAREAATWLLKPRTTVTGELATPGKFNSTSARTSINCRRTNTTKFSAIRLASATDTSEKEISTSSSSLSDWERPGFITRAISGRSWPRQRLLTGLGGSARVRAGFLRDTGSMRAPRGGRGGRFPLKPRRRGRTASLRSRPWSRVSIHRVLSPARAAKTAGSPSPI